MVNQTDLNDTNDCCFRFETVIDDQNHNGDTLQRRSFSTHAIVFTVVPVIALIFIISAGNALVIAAVLRDGRLNSQFQNWLILSLALADLLVGLLIMPITLTYELMDYWILGEAMCEIWLASDVFFVTASILNLCAISLDRYWSLTNPVYATSRTAKKILLMIGLVWTASFFICCPLILGQRATQEIEEQCFLSEDLGYVLYSSFGSFFIPVAILLVVYVRIYRITLRRARKDLRRTKKRQAMLGERDDDAATIGCDFSKTKEGRDHEDDQAPSGISSVSRGIGSGLSSTTWSVATLANESMINLASVPFGLSSPGQTSVSERLRSPPESKSARPFIKKTPSRFILARLRMDYHENSPNFERDDSTLALYAYENHLGRRKKLTRRRERQATSLLGLIVLAFVGCWTPFFCTYLLRAVCCTPPDLLFDIIFWMGYCNSAFNPFIYNFFNPEFRQAFSKILSPKKR